MLTDSAHFNVSTAARHLGVSDQTILNLCASGKIRGAFRLTDRPRSPWRIPRSSVEAYIRERQRAAEPPAPELTPDERVEKNIEEAIAWNKANRGRRGVRPLRVSTANAY